jgi:hypothetical protein
MAIKSRRLVIMSVPLQGMIRLVPVIKKQKKSPCHKDRSSKTINQKD